MTTTTATRYAVTLPDEDMAGFVASIEPGRPAMHRDGTTVLITPARLDRLRDRDPDCDGSITDDENGLRMWVGGIGHPLRPIR